MHETSLTDSPLSQATDPESHNRRTERPERRETPREFYTELLERALEEIDALAQDGVQIVMVCGPMRGQPGDDARSNLAILRQKIDEISRRSEEEAVFNQTNYLESELEGAPHELELKFEIFYGGIIRSGKIAKIYVLPTWQTSTGTQREITFATEAGISIEILPQE